MKKVIEILAKIDKGAFSLFMITLLSSVTVALVAHFIDAERVTTVVLAAVGGTLMNIVVSCMGRLVDMTLSKHGDPALLGIIAGTVIALMIS